MIKVQLSSAEGAADAEIVDKVLSLCELKFFKAKTDSSSWIRLRAAAPFLTKSISISSNAKFVEVYRCDEGRSEYIATLRGVSNNGLFDAVFDQSLESNHLWFKFASLKGSCEEYDVRIHSLKLFVPLHVDSVAPVESASNHSSKNQKSDVVSAGSSLLPLLVELKRTLKLEISNMLDVKLNEMQQRIDERLSQTEHRLSDLFERSSKISEILTSNALKNNENEQNPESFAVEASEPRADEKESNGDVLVGSDMHETQRRLDGIDKSLINLQEAIRLLSDMFQRQCDANNLHNNSNC